VWDLRSEPGLIDKFEKVWGTRELLVSYGTYHVYEFHCFYPSGIVTNASPL
jgi:hypothetical protein